MNDETPSPRGQRLRTAAPETLSERIFISCWLSNLSSSWPAGRERAGRSYQRVQLASRLGLRNGRDLEGWQDGLHEHAALHPREAQRLEAQRVPDRAWHPVRIVPREQHARGRGDAGGASQPWGSAAGVRGSPPSARV
jgi:hypothetical protein